MTLRRIQLIVVTALLASSLFTQAAFAVEYGLELEALATGLDRPVGVIHAGDDRLFIVTQPGRILILENGTLLSQPFIDISGRMSYDPDPNAELGLLSAAFHPNYGANGFFFVTYTDPAGDSVISRFSVSATNANRADAGSERTLLKVEQPGANHNVGQLQFGGDGYLYFSAGDGGYLQEPRCAGQEGDHLRGKLSRIDVDTNAGSAPYYSIPSTNPFVGDPDMRDEVWALGLRNPWRFSFDSATGDLYLADVGQDRREEINFEAAGTGGSRNYGFKMLEGTFCRGSSASCSETLPACSSPAYSAPAIEHIHDFDRCAVIGGYVYRGSRFPEFAGRYLYGDYCGAMGIAERVGGGLSVERLSNSLLGLVTFGQGRDGEIYLVANSTLYSIAAVTATESGTLSFTETNVTVSETNTFATLSVSRSEGTDNPVAVDWRTEAGSATSGLDYVSVSQSLSWGAGDASTKTIQIPLVADGDAEDSETFQVLLSNPTGGASLGNAEATVTITDGAGGSTCVANATTMCLRDGRFRIAVSWRKPDGVAGPGTAVGLTAESGYFWFFGADNPELFVKVIDACDGFDNFWLFSAGLTNVEVNLSVTDTRSGQTKIYRSIQGTRYEAVQDTAAFATCDL